MQAIAQADPVSVYLKRHGFAPEVAYFEGGGFVMGWRLCLGDFTWVYRVDGDTLTVCDLTAVQDPQGQGSGRAVSQFVALIQRIGREVSGVRRVRGRFMEQFAVPELNLARQRLADVLLAKGAQWQDMEGDAWLVYSYETTRRP